MAANLYLLVARGQESQICTAQPISGFPSTSKLADDQVQRVESVVARPTYSPLESVL
jgi:hypothetical protein